VVLVLAQLQRWWGQTWVPHYCNFKSSGKHELNHQRRLW